MDAVEAEFLRIRQDHREAVKRRAARVVCGASVIRVFAKGTKQPLMEALAELDLEALAALGDQAEFRRWFVAALNRVARRIEATNGNNARIMPGYKWGHGTKVLALYVREVVLNSRYFADEVVARVEPWLYVPIDGVVMDHCRRVGLDPGVRRIKDIDTPTKFFRLQELLTAPAERAGVPRVWFDDAWGDRPS
jgi:hypothetical protein